MKMYTNCKIDLPVYSLPPKTKDMQLLINQELWVLPYGGQLSTETLVLQFALIFIAAFLFGS